MGGGYTSLFAPEPGQYVVSCEGIHVFYPGAESPALKDVTFHLKAGQTLALLGHNGAGKSTLLKVLAAQLQPRAGSVTLWGHPPGKFPHKVAYLEQRASLRWSFPITLRELVTTGTYVHLGWLRNPGKEQLRAVDEAIARLGLTDFARRNICDLSGGQQQRALLARALVHDADLLLLDEPFTAVDQETQQILLRILNGLKNQGKTLVISTHDLEAFTELNPVCLHLRQGQICNEDCHTHSNFLTPT